MKTVLTLGLQSSLRLFGAFWIFGGFLTLQAARESLFMDRVLDALTPQKEDRLLSYFLFLSSLLTISTGGALLLASCWALLPLGLLIGPQVVYINYPTLLREDGECVVADCSITAKRFRKRQLQCLH